MEGGANVIAEAVISGTPVIASEIPGNAGMLGREYPGFFPVHDESALARCLVQACGDRSYLRELARACAARRKLFSLAAEARAVRSLARALLA
jgi:glycosyltransferase involved in cell wall biosynthesis